MLALRAGTLRDERRRDHLTRIAPFGERALQHVARTTGFITDAEVTLVSEVRHIPAQSGRVVGQAIDPRGGLRALG